MSALADPFTSPYAVPRAVFSAAPGGVFARPKATAAPRRGPPPGSVAFRIPRFAGTFLLAALFLGVGALGAWRGGELDAFLAQNGSVK